MSKIYECQQTQMYPCIKDEKENVALHETYHTEVT
jgi:hypothetical protein